MLVVPGTIRGNVQVTTYIVLVCGIIFTIWYPKHLKKKYATIPSHDAT